MSRDLGGFPERWPTLEAYAAATEVVIDFSDARPGLAEAERGRIFAASCTTRPCKGSGLGLTLARRTVEIQDGRMEARSNGDGCALFRICSLSSARTLVGQH